MAITLNYIILMIFFSCAACSSLFGCRLIFIHFIWFVSFSLLLCIVSICSSKMIWCEYEILMVLTLSFTLALYVLLALLLLLFIKCSIYVMCAVSVCTEYVNDSMVFHFLSLIIYTPAQLVYPIPLFRLLAQTAFAKNWSEKEKKLKR